MIPCPSVVVSFFSLLQPSFITTWNCKLNTNRTHFHNSTQISRDSLLTNMSRLHASMSFLMKYIMYVLNTLMSSASISRFSVWNASSSLNKTSITSRAFVLTLLLIPWSSFSTLNAFLSRIGQVSVFTRSQYGLTFVVHQFERFDRIQVRDH